MAASDGDTTEVYAVLPGSLTWERFAAAALQPLGCPSVPPGVSLLPRAGGYAVSVRHDRDGVTRAHTVIRRLGRRAQRGQSGTAVALAAAAP